MGTISGLNIRTSSISLSRTISMQSSRRIPRTGLQEDSNEVIICGLCESYHTHLSHSSGFLSRAGPRERLVRFLFSTAGGASGPGGAGMAIGAASAAAAESVSAGTCVESIFARAEKNWRILAVAKYVKANMQQLVRQHQRALASEKVL